MIKMLRKIETLIEVPLIEDLPQGFMAARTGKRGFRWRDDKPCNDYLYQKLLDGGDPSE